MPEAGLEPATRGL